MLAWISLPIRLAALCTTSAPGDVPVEGGPDLPRDGSKDGLGDASVTRGVTPVSPPPVTSVSPLWITPDRIGVTLPLDRVTSVSPLWISALRRASRFARLASVMWLA